MSCLSFAENQSATGFARILVERGLDVSVQSYKADCPPTMLTKLPLIAGFEVVDFVVDQMRAALFQMRGNPAIPAGAKNHSIQGA